MVGSFRMSVKAQSGTPPPLGGKATAGPPPGGVSPPPATPGRAPAQVGGERGGGRFDHRETLAPDVLENSPVYFLDALVFHEARVERHRRLVRDDRLGLLTGEAALAAADV